VNSIQLTPVIKLARGNKPDLQIGLRVITCDKNKQKKVFLENFGIWTGKASTSEKENNNNLDHYLNLLYD